MTETALPLLTCPSCGVMAPPRVEDGPRPGKRRKAVCARCGHYLKWLPKPPAREESRRMESLNSVSLVGILERDPVTKFEGDRGIQVTTFTLRLDEPGKGAKAGQVFRVYIPVECYTTTAERAADLNAGDLVGLEGKLVWRRATDPNGQKPGSLVVFARQVSLLQAAAVVTP
jgi:Single-strand binding protein family